MNHVDENQIEQHIKQTKYVIVAFIDEHEAGEELSQYMEKIAKQHKEDEDFLFVTTLVYTVTKENLEKFDITHSNEIHLYIDNFRKKFHSSDLLNFEEWF